MDEDSRKESIESTNYHKESEDELAYNESQRQITARLAPWDTQMFKCVVRQSKNFD